MHPGSRRSCVFISILAAASLATSRSAAADESFDRIAVELRLAVVDFCGTAPELRHGTLRGIQALLEPVGITVTGRTVFPGEDEATGGIYVVLMPAAPNRSRAEPVGGTARRENGRQLTVWAFPPWVAGGLGLDLGEAPHWTHRDRLQFQRAMAVVVVHEIAHALAGARHHPDGLMSARLGRRQLLDPKLVVDADLHEPLRAAIARLELAPAHAR